MLCVLSPSPLCRKIIGIIYDYLYYKLKIREKLNTHTHSGIITSSDGVVYERRTLAIFAAGHNSQSDYSITAYQHQKGLILFSLKTFPLFQVDQKFNGRLITITLIAYCLRLPLLSDKVYTIIWNEKDVVVESAII